MITFVADASVIVKWALPDRQDEADTEAALGLLDALRFGYVRFVQPPHWLAEVAGVLIRLAPSSAKADVINLYRLSLPVVDTLDVYRTACDLSRRLEHHLFDTLYHAVALHHSDTTLVTADEAYFRKAKRYGRIQRLRDAPHRIAQT